MFVSVSFYDESVNGFKTGRSYTYRTAMDLHDGDIVAAPVKNRGTGAIEDKRAMVVWTGLTQPSFPCSEIVAYWTEGKNDGSTE